MGGCCCFFSSRRSEPVRAPTYYYCPRTSEEREPLSANYGIPPGLAGLLVDTNLDTSSLDTYTPPPAPLPYDVDLGRPQTPQGRESHITKSDTARGIENSILEEGSNNVESMENRKKELKELDDITQSELELAPSEDLEDDLKKPVESNLTITEEDCPICLEEYTEENPKMLTKCEHHFHLCCILEWMERSDTCPVCDKEVVADELVNF